VKFLQQEVINWASCQKSITDLKPGQKLNNRPPLVSTQYFPYPGLNRSCRVSTFPTAPSRSFHYPVSTAVLLAPNPGRSTERGGNATGSSCDLLHKKPSPVTTILSRNRHRKRRFCYKPVTGNHDSVTNPSPVTTTLLQIIGNTVAGRSVPPEWGRKKGRSDARTDGRTARRCSRVGEGQNLWQVAREPFSVDHFTIKLPWIFMK
jgi:hypothetical protein